MLECCAAASSSIPQWLVNMEKGSQTQLRVAVHGHLAAPRLASGPWSTLTLPLSAFVHGNCTSANRNVARFVSVGYGGCRRARRAEQTCCSWEPKGRLKLYVQW